MIAKQTSDGPSLHAAQAYANKKAYPTLNTDYRWLISYLQDEFHKYHTEKQRKLSSGAGDVSQMTGVEFERYLANIFKSSGYNIEMTPEA